MEEEQQKSVKSPWLLYLGNIGNDPAFCSASRPHRYCTFRERESYHRLRNKIIWNYNDGWMLLSKDQITFTLFNPNTNKTKSPPALSDKPRRDINAGVLWLSPDDNSSNKVVLFDRGRSSMEYYCYHKKKWFELSYKTKAEKLLGDDTVCDDITISHPVKCNGKLYALLNASLFALPSKPLKVVEIDILEETGRLRIKSLGSEVPLMNSHSSSQINYWWWLVESQGDLFAINVVCGGVGSAEAIDVGVFRWDFNSLEQEWREVKGSEIEDRAFFLSCGGQSLSCTTTGQEFEGGRVYFVASDIKRLYSFDVKDGSVTMSLPSGNLFPSVWVMLSYSRNNIKKKKSTTASSSKCESINFLDLPYDVNQKIAEKLRPIDFRNLRATSKACYQLTPPTRWRTGVLAQGQSHSPPPWLMFSRSDSTLLYFIDMKFGGMFTTEANRLLYGAKIRCSRGGWVLMTNMDENLFFFYNPFTFEVIRLPEAPEQAAKYDSFCFTGVPSSHECLVMGVQCGFVLYFDMRKQRWRAISDFNPEEGLFGLAVHNTPIFFNRAVYILGADGALTKLIIDDENRQFLLDRFHCPCPDFCQNFLLEWDQKLAAVFINSAWTSIQVFTFNENEQEWEEVLSLGKSSFFLSSCSAFSITTNIPEIENKIYLSKIYEEDKIIFYCLETRTFGCTTSEMSIDSQVCQLCGMKEYLSSCWIEPCRS